MLSLKTATSATMAEKSMPGLGQHHNLQLKYVSGARVHGSRLDGSISGCGLHVRKGSNVSVVLVEAARNAQSGMCFVDCERVSVQRSLVEGNDGLESTFDLAAKRRRP